MTRNKNSSNSFTIQFKKTTMHKKRFTNSKDACEYHQRLQFSLERSKTVPFWSVHKQPHCDELFGNLY